MFYSRKNPVIITGFDSLRGVFTTTEGDIPVRDMFPLLLGDKHTLKKSFDPCSACRGRCLKDVKDCFEPHVVYIALFGSMVKIGVTREKRLPCRLKEQGADAGIPIACVEDGERARRIEQEYSRKLQIPDRISTEDMVKAVSEFDISILERYADIFGTGCMYVINYNPLRITGNPIKITPGKGLRIGGEVAGNRGKAIFLRRGDIYYWINGDDLAGYYATSTRGYDVQTSLREW